MYMYVAFLHHFKTMHHHPSSKLFTIFFTPRQKKKQSDFYFIELVNFDAGSYKCGLLRSCVCSTTKKLIPSIRFNLVRLGLELLGLGLELLLFVRVLCKGLLDLGKLSGLLSCFKVKGEQGQLAIKTERMRAPKKVTVRHTCFLT